MNVPVLAWDDEKLVDPRLLEFVTPETHVSSVPYFDARCGRRFKLDAFEAEFERFEADLSSYQPRAYVAERLSQEECAYRYVSLYLDAETR